MSVYVCVCLHIIHAYINTCGRHFTYIQWLLPQKSLCTKQLHETATRKEKALKMM